MRIAYVTSQCQFFAKLFAEVHADVSGSHDTVSGSSTSHTSAPSSSHSGEHVGGNIRESHIIRIVQTSHQCELIVVNETIDHKVPFISVLTAISGKSISEPSLFHSRLDGQVDNGFFLSVVKSGHPCHVAQTVQYLHFLNHFRGKIFRSDFRVIREELFPVDQDFLDLFPVDSNLSFTVHFHTWHLFQ